MEESLRALMEQVNAQLDPHERVRFLAVAEGPWTVGNGFITPTLKIKRAVLEARYQALIDDWTERNSPVVWESALSGRARPTWPGRGRRGRCGRATDRRRKYRRRR